MKLLNPSEVQDMRAQQLARDAMRSKELNKAADDARKNLAKAQADFQQVLAGQQTRWAKEEAEHVKDVSERQAELAVLESKRQKALEPVKLIEDQARKTLLEAQNALIEAQKREADAEDLSLRLQDKLDAIGGREMDMLDKEKKLRAKEENIRLQQKIADDNTDFVKKSLILLKAEQKRIDAELDKKRTELILKERSLEARDDGLKNREKELEVWATQLKDERGTLERAFARIRTSPRKEKA